MRQELAQPVVLLLIDVHKTHETLSRRLHLLLDLIEDGHCIVVAAYNQSIETDLACVDVVFHTAGDDDSPKVNQAELQEKQCEERLVIHLVGEDLVVEDGHEKQHRDTQQGDEEGL